MKLQPERQCNKTCGTCTMLNMEGQFGQCDNVDFVDIFRQFIFHSNCYFNIKKTLRS